jgi:hypothetical protein
MSLAPIPAGEIGRYDLPRSSVRAFGVGAVRADMGPQAVWTWLGSWRRRPGRVSSHG